MQADLNGKTVDDRRAKVLEHLRAQTRSLGTDDKQQFLNDLKYSFPPFGEVPRDKPPRPDGLTPEDFDNEQKLVVQLAKLAMSNPARLKMVQDLLRQLKLMPPPPPNLMGALRKALKLRETAMPVEHRVWELLAVMIDAINRAEEVYRNTYTAFGRNRDLQGQRRIADAMADYVCLVDGAPNLTPVGAEVQDLKNKLCQRLLTVGALFRNFTDDMAERIAPARLSRSVSGWGKFKKIWQKWIREIGGEETQQVKETILKQFEMSLQRISSNSGNRP